MCQAYPLTCWNLKLGVDRLRTLLRTGWTCKRVRFSLCGPLWLFLRKQLGNFLICSIHIYWYYRHLAGCERHDAWPQGAFSLVGDSKYTVTQIIYDCTWDSCITNEQNYVLSCILVTQIISVHPLQCQHCLACCLLNPVMPSYFKVSLLTLSCLRQHGHLLSPVCPQSFSFSVNGDFILLVSGPLKIQSPLFFPCLIHIHLTYRAINFALSMSRTGPEW